MSTNEWRDALENLRNAVDRCERSDFFGRVSASAAYVDAETLLARGETENSETWGEMVSRSMEIDRLAARVAELEGMLEPVEPAAAEKARQPTHVAIICKHGTNNRKAVLVPAGQSLDFDDGEITRKWLWPYLGNDHHLVEFLEIPSPPAATGEKP